MELLPILHQEFERQFLKLSLKLVVLYQLSQKSLALKLYCLGGDVVMFLFS